MPQRAQHQQDAWPFWSLAQLRERLVGGLTAWRTWRALGGRWPETEGGPAARSRFLSGLGVLLGGLCVLVILAFWVAVFLLDPCQ